jgi:hypothetical protein
MYILIFTRLKFVYVLFVLSHSHFYQVLLSLSSQLLVNRKVSQ